MNVYFRPNSKLLLWILLVTFTTLGSANELSKALEIQGLSRKLYQMDAGYFVDPRVLDDSFFYYEITGYVFNPLKAVSPYTLRTEVIESLEPLVVPLQTYISEHKKGSMIHCEENLGKCSETFEKLNGITERELALEIVKASFCFGTDPFIITSKIRQESRFDMAAVSGTGAVGLTQLTNIGIAEILDQMGHRGPKYAFVENKEYLTAGAQCYLAQSGTETVGNFPKILTYTNKNGSREYTPETLKNMERWVLPARQHSKINNKKVYIQRQIFLGHVLLKIYLAYSKMVSPKQTTARHYDAALRMFNGDDIRVQYAKEVMRNSKPGLGL